MEFGTANIYIFFITLYRIVHKILIKKPVTFVTGSYSARKFKKIFYFFVVFSVFFSSGAAWVAAGWAVAG